MLIMHYIKLFIGAFHDKDSYIHVAHEEKGYFIKYLAFILVICSMPLYLKSYFDFNKYMKDEGLAIIEKLPELYFKHGEVFLEEALPLEINEGESSIIIDSSNTYLNVLDSEADLLIRPKEMQIKLEGISSRIAFDAFHDMRINSTTIKDSVSWVKWILTLVFILSLIFQVGFYYIFCYVLAFLGNTLNNIYQVGLDKQALIRISILAIGPMLFLDLLIKILGIDIGGLGILSFLMPALFIYIGIQANAEYIEGNKPKLS
tara:strand:+ start:214 stop:993 length:780 start_codon:yes stop_codon:yes gene_type:complete